MSLGEEYLKLQSIKHQSKIRLREAEYNAYDAIIKNIRKELNTLSKLIRNSRKTNN